MVCLLTECGRAPALQVLIMADVCLLSSARFSPFVGCLGRAETLGWSGVAERSAAAYTHVFRNEMN